MRPVDDSRAMYDLLAQGDWDGVETFLAEDFVVFEPPSLPYGGEWRGRDALRRHYRHVMDFWDSPQVQWIDLIGGDDHTVAILRLTAKARSTGRLIDQKICEVTRFSESRMTEMHIHYFDTAAILAALED